MPFCLEMSKNITKQLYILYGIHHTTEGFFEEAIES